MRTRDQTEIDEARGPHRKAESLRIELEVTCTADKTAALPRQAVRLLTPDKKNGVEHFTVSGIGQLNHTSGSDRSKPNS